jgi:hypothetical protein
MIRRFAQVCFLTFYVFFALSIPIGWMSYLIFGSIFFIGMTEYIVHLGVNHKFTEAKITFIIFTLGLNALLGGIILFDNSVNNYARWNPGDIVFTILFFLPLGIIVFHSVQAIYDDVLKTKPCPKCNAPTIRGANNCINCGTNLKNPQLTGSEATGPTIQLNEDVLHKK